MYSTRDPLYAHATTFWRRRCTWSVYSWSFRVRIVLNRERLSNIRAANANNMEIQIGEMMCVTSSLPYSLAVQFLKYTLLQHPHFSYLTFFAFFNTFSYEIPLSSCICEMLMCGHIATEILVAPNETKWMGKMGEKFDFVTYPKPDIYCPPLLARI